ncbi:Cyclic nucleotide-gated ion channel 1 [Linum perenne]
MKQTKVSYFPFPFVFLHSLSETSVHKLYICLLLVCNLFMRIFNPRETLVRRWDKVLLVTSAAAVLIDPLFLYILRINYRTREKHLMIGFDEALLIAATTFRSIADVLCGLVRVFFKFRTAFPAHSSRAISRVELVDDASAIARRYFTSFVLVDFLALLPLPQVIVVVGLISRNTRRIRLLTPAITWLHLVLSLQLVPRLVRFYQLYQDVVKSSYAIKNAAFVRTSITIFLYITAAHVVGAFWYSFSIRREMDCWGSACRHHAGCDYTAMLTFGNDGKDNWSFLNRTCPKGGAESGFDYGMFADAVKSGVLESTDFDKKLLYSFWWGLQSLSTLGQNVKPSINSLEICFALCIFIAGLLLFSQVIGIIQTRMLTSTIRMEEMKMKWEDVEKWMSSHFIPRELQRRLRRHQEYRWRTDQGVDFNHVLDNVPKDLRRDVKRHLWLPLLMRVPLFGNMDEHMLDAMCDRLKPALYTEGSYIVREDDPVDEMIFILKGKLESVTTNGGMVGFFNAVYLKSGDFCGEEILTYVLTPNPVSSLGYSTRTVRAVTEVEAFALAADDLKLVASQFLSQISTERFRRTFRFYSQQWRTWAACFIQAAWRRYSKKKKLEEGKLQAEAAMARPGGNLPSIGATIYASRCFTFTSFVFVDFLALLPLSQVTVVVGFSSIDTRRIRLLTPAMTWLHLVLFIQWVPRLVRFYQLYQDVVVKSSYAIRKAAFVWTLITIFFTLLLLITLGQNVKPSINSLEICFALCIFIAGLLLFTQVIGLIQVPIFVNMDEYMLDALCDLIKPAFYTEGSCIIREEDPVDEMLFIMIGKLKSDTTNGGMVGFYNTVYLESGDFCGEEIMTYVLTPNPVSSLVFSTRTVRAYTEVEGFTLAMDDLKLVVAQFHSHVSTQQFRHTFRFYSQQWRTWAACIIQAAWRRYNNKKKKLEEGKVQVEAAMVRPGRNLSRIGAAIHASRFVASALRVIRRNPTRYARIS